jgi:hypothetical protein
MTPVKNQHTNNMTHCSSAGISASSSSAGAPAAPAFCRFRGIENVSKVSCHIACAIQILCHAITPIQEALVILSSYIQQMDNGNCNDDNNGVFLEELIDFLDIRHRQNVGSECDDDCDSFSSCWNPRRLYLFLQKHAGKYSLDYNEVGDSSSTLSHLLHLLNESEWERILKASVWEGETRQVLVGRKRASSSSSITWLQRTKPAKIKPMACPLVLKVPAPKTSDNAICWDLERALSEILEPQLVTGASSSYPWDTISPESYTECVIQDSNTSISYDDNIDHWSSAEWITTKQIEFQRIPRVWLLHLERPKVSADLMQSMLLQYKKGGICSIDIPLKIETSKFQSNIHVNGSNPQSQHHNATLFLRGAILQVVEDDKDERFQDWNTEDEYEYDDDMEVHCVTLLRNPRHPQDSSASTSWVLIDDDHCQRITEDHALSLMGGTVEMTDRLFAYYAATLLVYAKEQEDNDEEDEWKLVVREIHAAMTNQQGVNQRRSEAFVSAATKTSMSVVGRRVKVRWAKGKFYSGKITSYDPSTGKHRIEYDDGDVKDYVLGSKTIEWIDE